MELKEKWEEVPRETMAAKRFDEALADGWTARNLRRRAKKNGGSVSAAVNRAKGAKGR